MELERQSLTPKQSPLPLVAMMSSPGMGHLIPMIEFAKRLVVHHNLTITFLIPTDGPPSNTLNAVVRALPASISHIFLSPTVSNLPDHSPDAKPATLIAHTVLRSLPLLRDAFHTLIASHYDIVAFVVDHFSTDAFTIADEFKIPPYIFHVSTAMTLAFFLHLPNLDESFHSEYRDLPEPVQLPGCVPVHGRDLIDPVQDRNNEAYKWILHNTRRYRLAKGIIFNSFIDLEPKAINELQKTESGWPPVYPVGPLVNLSPVHNNDDGSESECLKWLDEQPHGSVLFVSFGSGWTLTSAQLEELAHGLEMSEERFMWVVRSPNDKHADGFYFKAQTPTDPFGFLPEGFVERTKGRGLLVTWWAPQAKILSHGSTGGFMSHCGWSSVLESMVNGVPLVAWPLFAEQKMNAVLLTEDMKVAVRPKVSESSGLVEREEIARSVKVLMRGGEEGNDMRQRMKKLKEAAANAYGENGCSTKQISQLALVWNNRKI